MDVTRDEADAGFPNNRLQRKFSLIRFLQKACNRKFSAGSFGNFQAIKSSSSRFLLIALNILLLLLYSDETISEFFYSKFE